jgi:hypothetical protein
LDENYLISKREVLRILKRIGFSYVKFKDGKKFLTELTDISAARETFLRTILEIRKFVFRRDYAHCEG